jgi:uncharacterized protein
MTTDDRQSSDIPDTSRFNGLQTTGRSYRNLSPTEHVVRRDVDVAATMRDGTSLLADVYRPQDGGHYPVLIAASPYPRQIQDLGAPTAIIEAGNSEFFVSRGYVHVIASLRGTGGSGGEWGMFDQQERDDLYDLVEWAAEQPWSDGHVGMIGINYFAIAQVGAAVTHPPHLEAIFPFEVTSDLYEAAYHYGLFSSSFITPWLTMIGVMAPTNAGFWRGHVANTARRILNQPAVHRRVGNINGESAKSVLRLIMKAPYDPHPWDDLWRAVAVGHQIRDQFWDERTVLPELGNVDIPVYIGCDWDNVPMHLPGTFSTWREIEANPQARMSLLPSGATTWPWESLHVEALAWFDQHLKGRDTSICDGPRIRFWLPVAEQWHTSDTWPPASTRLSLGLGGDGVLRLNATTTATDTAWIVALSDVAPDESVTHVTGGWQRASLREIDESTTVEGAPTVPCRNPIAVPPGEQLEYRIPLVPSARRFRAGHHIQLMITSDDQHEDVPVFLDYRHAPVGTSAHNTIDASSRLTLPILS